MDALIDACIATLERLPGLSVALEPRPNRTHGFGPNVFVTIRTSAGTDRYTAETSAHVSTKSLGALLSQLERLHATTDARPMLLTTHATRTIADALASRGIAYADTAGNAHLNGPSAYVLVQGRRPDRSPARKGLTRTDLLLVFALLSDLNLATRPQRAIAEATGISLGKVSGTLTSLAQHEFLRERNQRRQLCNPERLLQRWETGYLEVVRPALQPTSWSPGPNTTLEDLRDHAAELPDVLVGGEFAADVLTSALNPASLALHVPAGTAKRVAVDLRLRPTAPGAPAVVLLDRVLPGFDRASTADHRTSLAAIAHPILVRAELLAIGSDRLREVADQLRSDVILPRLRHDA